MTESSTPTPGERPSEQPTATGGTPSPPYSYPPMPPAPPGPVAASYPPAGASQYGQYPQYPYPATPQQPYYPSPWQGPETSGKATAVMVLGILAITLCVACGLGIIAAVVALCLAPGAGREIRESGGRLQGDGQLKAGVICSWVTVGLTVVGVLIFVALVVLAPTETTY